MDRPLRCNSLACRTPLPDRAVVTTCSHIFCVDCAQRPPLGIAADENGNGGRGGDARKCPACDTTLDKTDDAVLASLNPSEEYKTGVLSGLHPTIVAECAGRALAFWSYQAEQEILYQELLAKSLSEKYASLDQTLGNVVDQANAEIASLRDKLSAMQLEHKELESKNHELQDRYREKARNQAQLNKLYQTLKQQQIASGMEAAVDHDAEHVLHSVATGQRGPSQYQHSRVRSNGSGSGSGTRRSNNGAAVNNSFTTPPTWASHGGVGPHSLRSARGPVAAVPTAPPLPRGRRLVPSPTPASAFPSDHRRAPLHQHNFPDAAPRVASHHATPSRQVLGGLDSNIYAHGQFATRGGGLPAGVKTGRQSTTTPGVRPSIDHGRSGLGWAFR